MFKKKKYKKFSSEWYLQLFRQFTEDKISRSTIKTVYDEIYNYYKIKIREGNFDITNERILLEKKAGKHKGFATNVNMNLMIVPLTILITSGIQLFSSSVQAKYSAAIGFMFACLTFTYLIHEIDKDNTSEKEFIYHISLKVLDELEKNSTKNSKIDKANLEVAAPADKERTFQSSPINDSHITINFNNFNLLDIFRRITGRKK